MNLEQQMIYPMALYVFYVVGFFLYVFKCRVKAGRSGEYPPLYYKDYSGKQEMPRRFLILERHMDHQFQVPTWFLVTGAVFIAMDAVTMTTIYLAWGFVLSRFFHAYIHLGSNKILRRALAYAVGLLILCAMWLQLIFA